jgi:hypothetical protein
MHLKIWTWFLAGRVRKILLEGGQIGKYHRFRDQFTYILGDISAKFLA